MSCTPAPRSSPRLRIRLECERRGMTAVAADCVRLLAGEDADPQFVIVLGGEAAHSVLDGRDKPYWLRVWAARGLLWAWDDLALPSIQTAVRDEAWRVREMAAKVIARHVLCDALAAVATLQDDPVPRVRQASRRALEVLTAAE